MTGNLGWSPAGQRQRRRNNAYMKYENAVRRRDPRGVDHRRQRRRGRHRRTLYVDIPQQLITDFILPLHVISTRHRVVYDERVGASEAANKEMDSEFRMRVRVALRALQGLVYMRRL